MGNLAPPGDREDNASHHSADLKSNVLELSEYRCLHSSYLSYPEGRFGRIRKILVSFEFCNINFKNAL